MAELVELRPVDGVEVTVVMDNSIDILAASSEVAQRLALQRNWSEADQLRAEHGYSLALTVYRRPSRHCLSEPPGYSRAVWTPITGRPSPGDVVETRSCGLGLLHPTESLTYEKSSLHLREEFPPCSLYPCALLRKDSML